MDEIIVGRIQQEYSEFLTKLKIGGIETVRQHANEIVVKESICTYCVCNVNRLTERCKQYLVQQKNPLHILYKFWQRTGCFERTEDVGRLFALYEIV